MRHGRQNPLAGVVTLGLLLTAAPVATAAVVPAAPMDFNGDGYADLAVGTQYESIGTFVSAGTVNVLYGSANGLTATGDQLWHQGRPGVRGSLGAWRLFGHALASCDFDADGHADLAIAVPGDRVGQRNGLGSAVVLYGSPHGLTADGSQRWSSKKLGIASWADAGFSGDMAAADFDGDGACDLALVLRDGTTRILSGGHGGLTAEAPTTLPGPQGRPVAGDIDGDGFDDLALLVYPSDVIVYTGGTGGLRPDGATVTNLDRLGLGWLEGGGAIGDFNADGYGDLAAGATGARVGDADEAGAVLVIPGSSTGMAADGALVWHEDIESVPGRAESRDHFGHSLATGDLNGDATDDLAVGVPNDRIGGAVTVLYGGPTGLSAAGSERWTQDSPGVPNHCEANDRFGIRVTIADFGNGSTADLAIGAWTEGLGRVARAGMVNVIYGTAAGLTGSGAQGWSQNSPGVKGIAERRDGFGFALAR